MGRCGVKKPQGLPEVAAIAAVGSGSCLSIFPAHIEQRATLTKPSGRDDFSLTELPATVKTGLTIPIPKSTVPTGESGPTPLGETSWLDSIGGPWHHGGSKPGPKDRASEARASEDSTPRTSWLDSRDSTLSERRGTKEGPRRSTAPPHGGSVASRRRPSSCSAPATRRQRCSPSPWNRTSEGGIDRVLETSGRVRVFGGGSRKIGALSLVIAQ